jgi:hypothetical protein
MPPVAENVREVVDGVTGQPAGLLEMVPLEKL